MLNLDDISLLYLDRALEQRITTLKENMAQCKEVGNKEKLEIIIHELTIVGQIHTYTSVLLDSKGVK